MGPGRNYRTSECGATGGAQSAKHRENSLHKSLPNITCQLISLSSEQRVETGNLEKWLASVGLQQRARVGNQSSSKDRKERSRVAALRIHLEGYFDKTAELDVTVTAKAG